LSLLLEGIRFEQQQNHSNFRGKTSYFADFQVQSSHVNRDALVTSQTQPWKHYRGCRSRALEHLQVSILEELSMAGGLLTQSELHGMLTRAKRYRDMPLPERAATLEDIRTTLLGLRARCDEILAPAAAFCSHLCQHC
jgi:hypothetical protein